MAFIPGRILFYDILQQETQKSPRLNLAPSHFIEYATVSPQIRNVRNRHCANRLVLDLLIEILLNLSWVESIQHLASDEKRSENQALPLKVFPILILQEICVFLAQSSPFREYVSKLLCP